MIAAGADSAAGGAEGHPRPVGGDHRAASAAPWAASSMTARSPTTSKQGIVGKGFPIEVYNVLGAGDAFMSGFLRGWLKGEPHATSATWANACGAFAVIRLLCAPEYPSWAGAQLLPRAWQHATGRCARTRRSTTSTGRRRGGGSWPRLMALAIDHRKQLEDIAGDAAPSASRAFKVLAVEAAARGGRRPARLRHAARRQVWPRGAVRGCRGIFWIGRPIELPGSRPLRLRVQPGPRQPADRMAGRPLRSRCCASTTPTIPRRSRREQTEKLRAAYEAARKVGPRHPDRDHRLQARAGGRHDGGAGAGRALRCRAEAGLVEARAAGRAPRRGTAIDEVIEARDPLLPRRRDAGARCAAGRRWRAALPPPRPRARCAASPSAAPSLPTRPRRGLLGR